MNLNTHTANRQVTEAFLRMLMRVDVMSYVEIQQIVVPMIMREIYVPCL